MNKYQIRLTEQIKKAYKKLGYEGAHTAPVSELLQELEKCLPLDQQELIETLASYYNCDNEIIYYKTQYDFFHKFPEFCEDSATELYTELQPSTAVEKMALAGHSKLGVITAELLGINLDDLEQ